MGMELTVLNVGVLAFACLVASVKLCQGRRALMSGNRYRTMHIKARKMTKIRYPYKPKSWPSSNGIIPLTLKDNVWSYRYTDK